MALAILVVVILILAALAYLQAHPASSGTPTNTCCGPPYEPPTNILQVSQPFADVQVGISVPFSTGLEALGLTATSFDFNFGDGTSLSTNGSTANHTYASAGNYLVSVTAVLSPGSFTNVMTNNQSIVPVRVLPLGSSSELAGLPVLEGMIASNSTSDLDPTALVHAGESVNLTAQYSISGPIPAYSIGPPTFQLPPNIHATTITGTNSTTSLMVFPDPGLFSVVATGVITPSTGPAEDENYTWTVLVAPKGQSASVAGQATPRGPPPPSTLPAYELAPGGSFSEDPAIDYETIGEEPIENVYQTLITYNGTDLGPLPQDFVPVLATCVPGSEQCVRQWGVPLESPDQENYTFVLQSSARFYDPGTKASWPVYPSDVVFSVARDLAFSALPSYGTNNGWLLAQALLDPGDPTWDGGVHAAVNNTPLDIFESMSVNDTAAGCPSAALVPGASNGCVTFHAFGGHHVWPFFLELMAIPVAGAVEPAGWFSAPDRDAGIPGWTYGPNASVPVTGSGDHPVPLPGGFESTTGTFYAWIAANLPPTAWDMYEEIGSGAAVSGQYWGNVRYSLVGSGPYYMRDLVPGVSYLLQANPAYVQNPYCTWSGCAPAAGSYVGNVSVSWETSELPGEEAYAAGTADFATIPPPSTSLTLQLQQEGKIDLTATDSLTISAFAFDLDYDVAGVKNLTNDPVTIPSNFFSYTAARQLFIHSFDYAATENGIETSYGIQYAQPEGGAIPRFLENYYPVNISWPSSDANNNSSAPDSAAWWWEEGRDATSPYYDPELAGCTASSPCQFPAFGEFVTSPAELSLWAGSIDRVTGGAVKVDGFEYGCDDLVCSQGPGRDPLPVFDTAWSADYPDPSDFAEPFYAPNSTYTDGDAVYQQLIGNGPSAEGPFFALSCRPSDPPTVVTSNGTITSGNLSDLIYWANAARFGYGIATDCQGAAYREMIEALPVAEAMPSGSTRALAYDLIEQIEAGLGLYVWTGQAINVQSFATMIDPMDVSTNPALGMTWYTIAP